MAKTEKKKAKNEVKKAENAQKSAKKSQKTAEFEQKTTKTEESGCDKVKKVVKMITKTLKEEQRYTPLLQLQAEHTAILKVIVDRMAYEILDGKLDYIEVSTSREGNERYRQSPLYQLFAQYMDRYQDSLKALGMNVDSKPVKKEERGIDDFLDTFRDDD